MTEEKFETWALIELFGHTRIAGKVSEQNIAGTNMLRIDIPETTHNPKHTKFYGSSAIYGIHPIDEETARSMAENFNIQPVESWDIKEFLNKNNALMSHEN